MTCIPHSSALCVQLAAYNVTNKHDLLLCIYPKVCMPVIRCSRVHNLRLCNASRLDVELDSDFLSKCYACYTTSDAAATAKSLYHRCRKGKRILCTRSLFKEKVCLCGAHTSNPVTSTIRAVSPAWKRAARVSIVRADFEAARWQHSS
jgi:hypothetical protein